MNCIQSNLKCIRNINVSCTFILLFISENLKWEFNHILNYIGLPKYKLNKETLFIHVFLVKEQKKSFKNKWKIAKTFHPIKIVQ